MCTHYYFIGHGLTRSQTATSSCSNNRQEMSVSFPADKVRLCTWTLFVDMCLSVCFVCVLFLVLVILCVVPPCRFLHSVSLCAFLKHKRCLFLFTRFFKVLDVTKVCWEITGKWTMLGITNERIQTMQTRLTWKTCHKDIEERYWCPFTAV